MMRLTTLALFCLAAFAVNAPSAEGLAFVASMMRIPTIGPVAALKSFGRMRTQPSKMDWPVTVLSQSARVDAVAKDSTYQFGSDDASVKAMRNEMVDIVYQRSLERLDGFAMN